MTTVVVSQPMFLPWIGLFEQIKQADIFVHYDDVQRPQGRSFVSRVQIRRNNAIEWLTAPVNKANSGRLISETRLTDTTDWAGKHQKTLRHAYGRSPNAPEMLDLMQRLYLAPSPMLADFNIQAIEQISGALDLQTEFLRSSEMGIGGHSTARLVDICKSLGATRYVTGHGARNYMDHDAFEAVGIEVFYMSYQSKPWAQGNENFTPYVSILDTISSVPTEKVVEHMTSVLVPWREFVSRTD